MIHVLERLKLRAQKNIGEERKIMLEVYDEIKEEFFCKELTFLSIYKELDNSILKDITFKQSVRLRTLLEILYEKYKSE